ncbi:MAG: M23 family peptidase [Proteobacteria bacterium]|jgi:murein DD-endopeptidase MepM/ murein hydrolase activator NlpD|nr:MAG: M23 family peptidase [Pseudomonadota bacterium]
MRYLASILGAWLLLSGIACAGDDHTLKLDGNFTQGGLIKGVATPGSEVTLDGAALRLDRFGRFVFGFGRDAPASATLVVRYPDGTTQTRLLAIKQRQFDIQRIDGLPPKMVTPDAATLQRIEQENAMVAAARKVDTHAAWFWDGFRRPAEGRISGVYGSQRILNGEPRQPHYGLDIAGPRGSPVLAPAAGIVRLASRDFYYTGGTVIIDHGHGVSSSFLHLDRVEVNVGDKVEAGDLIGALGATGRATGPHLDWRVNWFDVRLDPGLLLEAR